MIWRNWCHGIVKGLERSSIGVYNGSMGIVLERNEKYQHLPKILLLKDEHKKPVKKKLVDLVLVERNKIDRSFLIKQDYPDGYDGIKVADYQHFIGGLSGA